MNSFVLKGDICHSETPTRLHTQRAGYLVCEAGRVAGVFASLPGRYAGLPLHDHSGKMILPGLVDLHVHAPQHTFAGLGMDLELLDWLNAHTFPAEAKFRDLPYAEKAYAAFVEELRRGPNTRAAVFATTHVPATLLLMDMLEGSGLACLVGKVNMDRNGSPEYQEQDAAASLAATREWLNACAGRHQNTRPILTPRFIPACTAGLMQGLAAIQQRQGLAVQSHLCENEREVSWVKELCPGAQSYGDAYHRFGLFGGGVPTIMAHCVWPSQLDLQLLQQNDVYVAHCPQSNTNLSSGIAPVRMLLGLDIRVGLGSDVAGGCHTSIFRAMADAVQVSKLRWRLLDETNRPLTLHEAFYLGTRGGGAFFGRVGAFDPGYEFDALVIDDAPLAPPDPLPLEDRLARIIYLSDDRHIRAKFVSGRRVL